MNFPETEAAPVTHWPHPPLLITPYSTRGRRALPWVPMTESDSADSGPTNISPFTTGALPTGLTATATLEPFPDSGSVSYPRTSDSPLWTITLGLLSAGLLVLVAIFWLTASVQYSTIRKNQGRTAQSEAGDAVRRLQLNEARAVNILLQRQLAETKALIPQLYTSLDRSRAETKNLQLELGQFRALSPGSPPIQRDDAITSAPGRLAQTLAYIADAQTQAAELMTRLEKAAGNMAPRSPQSAGE